MPFELKAQVGLLYVSDSTMQKIGTYVDTTSLLTRNQIHTSEQEVIEVLDCKSSA